MNATERNLVKQANAALREVRLRRELDERLMKAMLNKGIQDYTAGETPVERAIRYFEGKDFK